MVSDRAGRCPQCGAPVRTTLDKILPKETHRPVRGFISQMIIKWLVFTVCFGTSTAIGINVPMPAGAAVIFSGAVVGIIAVFIIQHRYYG
jgi:uncharacterized membrane protein